MLLAPLALALAVLAVPIILMYVLKLRRQEFVVPSTFLWRQALEDIQANAPWQRLRFNILLLLQLLALAALILALARPAYSRSHVIAGDVVVIVDESYGMQACDQGSAGSRFGCSSRFVTAQARAETLASELGGSNVMSVIGMSAQPHLAIAESGDQGALGRAIRSLRVGVEQPNFLEALSLAASLARAGQNTRVIVLTSRDSGIANLPLQVAFPVDIVRIGGPLHDLGVTAFSAARRGSGVAAVARVSNFGSQTAHSDLDLLLDGHLADVRPLTVVGGQQQNLVWTDLPAGIQRLQVRLTRGDDVSTDKSAWAAVPAEVIRRIMLVSSGDYFLEAALLDDPSVNLSVVPPLAYIPGMERGYDLTIFDGVLPPATPTGSVLLVAPPAGQLGPLRFGRTAPGGAVEGSPSATGSPGTLLRYVDLGDVHVARVRSVSIPGWLQPLATSNGHILLAVGESPPVGTRSAGTPTSSGPQGGAASGGYHTQGVPGASGSRFALVSFDLQQSDWPLRISFPIMLQNLLHYLSPGLTLGANEVTSGQAVPFFPPPGTRELQVTLPDGRVDHIAPPFPPFTDTALPGLYSVKAVRASSAGTQASLSQTATSSQSFAVDFFPARPAPAPGPTILHLGRGQAGKTLIASIPVGIAWAFELLALMILALEWWISFRGLRLV